MKNKNIFLSHTISRFTYDTWIDWEILIILVSNISDFEKKKKGFYKKNTHIYIYSSHEVFCDCEKHFYNMPKRKTNLPLNFIAMYTSQRLMSIWGLSTTLVLN